MESHDELDDVRPGKSDDVPPSKRTTEQRASDESTSLVCFYDVSLHLPRSQKMPSMIEKMTYNNEGDDG